MNPMDEAERLRLIDGDDDDDRTQLDASGPLMGLVVVGITKTITTYPTAVGKAFAFTPQAVLGTEAEAASAALQSMGGTQYAFLIHGNVPAVGSTILAFRVPYRFVFEY